jgi:hypothetical protein
MKRILSLSLFALLAGCTTLAPGTIDALARSAGTAAKLAAQYDVAHRPQYVLTKAALDELIAREAWDNASLGLALKQLPEVYDSKIALYVEGSLLAYDLITKVFFKIDSAATVKAFALELRDGLAVGLATAAPAASKSGPPATYPLTPRPPRPLQVPRSI